MSVSSTDLGFEYTQAGCRAGGQFTRGEEGPLRRIRGKIGRSLGAILHKGDASTVQPSGTATDPKEARPAVLIYVIQEKFVRYLLPVTDRLPVPYAYLLNVNLTAVNREL